MPIRPEDFATGGALLRGGATPGTVDAVVADFGEVGEPMQGFRER